MAELIPPEYRIKTAIDRRIRSWGAYGIATAVFSVASLAATYGWKQHRAAEFAALDSQYHTKSVLIAEAKDLQSRRVDLAGHMKKLQQLMEDNTLLSLLDNISNGFSANDCLDFISVQTNSDAPPAEGGKAETTKKADTPKYAVRISGITASDTTHADLLNRLTQIGAKSNPPISINPESLKREPLYDGQVFRFQILCEQPLAKGG